jgi:hypothetical protein
MAIAVVGIGFAAVLVGVFISRRSKGRLSQSAHAAQLIPPSFQTSEGQSASSFSIEPMNIKHGDRSIASI